MKKVLILSYYWPPAGGPGVQRWLKFVKYLPQFNIEPVIVTVDPSRAEYPIRDESLARDVQPDLQVYRTPCAGLYDFYKKFTKSSTAPYSGFANEGRPNLKQKISRFIRGNFFLPDARKGWNRYAYRQVLQLIRAQGIDTVITTGPPMSTHLVGRRLKRQLSIRWITDFRDPWTDIFYYDKLYPTALARRIDRRMERNVLLQADHIITVSPFLRGLLAAKSPAIHADKISVIPNGYDADDFLEPAAKESTFTITYTGTLAANYSLDGLIAVLAEWNAPFRLRFVGKVDPQIQQQIQQQLGAKVEFLSFVPHVEAIRHMQSSTLLLLVIPDSADNKGNLTGKLFEYIGSRTPILCLGPVDGDAAAIITSAQAGATFDYRDKAGIQHFLEQQANASLTPSPASSPENASRFSRENLTRTLSRLLLVNEQP